MAAVHADSGLAFAPAPVHGSFMSSIMDGNGAASTSRSPQTQLGSPRNRRQLSIAVPDTIHTGNTNIIITPGTATLTEQPSSSMPARSTIASAGLMIVRSDAQTNVASSSDSSSTLRTPVTAQSFASDSQDAEDASEPYDASRSNEEIAVRVSNEGLDTQEDITSSPELLRVATFTDSAEDARSATSQTSSSSCHSTDQTSEDAMSPQKSPNLPLFETTVPNAASNLSTAERANGPTPRYSDRAVEVYTNDAALPLVEGDGTYLTTATGLVGRYADGSTTPQRSASSRRSFFSSLLNLSSSFNSGTRHTASVDAGTSIASRSPTPSSSFRTPYNYPPQHLRQTSSPNLPTTIQSSEVQATVPRPFDGVFSTDRQLRSSSPDETITPLSAESDTPRRRTSSRSTIPSRTDRPRSNFSFPNSASASQNLGSASSSPIPPPAATLGRPQRSLTNSPALGSGSADSLAAKATPLEPPSLDAIGLCLSPLSPSLSLNKYGQALCGTILDGKYLLIGTTFGLDFLPLHRQGNKSAKTGLFERFSSGPSGSSSSSDPFSGFAAYKDVKTRKPISLVKKTRFKQLVILSERSNVLLAVAGRNDHVRVYALDSLRAVIEKKMKEIDEKEGTSNRPSMFASSASSPHSRHNHTATPPPPVPPIPSGFKGKQKAVGAPPHLSLHSSNLHTTSSSTSQVPANDVWSPPPAYDHPEASTSSSGPPGRRRSSASSGPPTPRVCHRLRSSPRHNSEGSTTSLLTSQLPSSPMSSPPHLKEHVVNSPRAMRRAKSREVLRKASHSAITSHASAMRKASPATVTQSAANSVITGTHHPIRAPHSPSTSTDPQNHAFGESTSDGDGLDRSQAGDESYEWMDSEEVPPEGHSQAVASCSSQESASDQRDKGKSPASRMKPRSPVVQDPSTEEETSDSQETASIPKDEAEQVAMKLRRRLSLAEILKETLAPPSLSADMAQRSISANAAIPAPTVKQTLSRPMARSATVASTIAGSQSLIDFFRDGPEAAVDKEKTSEVEKYDPSSAKTASSPRPLQRQASFTPSATSSDQIARLLPRPPVMSNKASVETDQDLLDLLKQGPASQPRAFSPVTRRHKRLSKMARSASDTGSLYSSQTIGDCSAADLPKSEGQAVVQTSRSLGDTGLPDFSRLRRVQTTPSNAQSNLRRGLPQSAKRMSYQAQGPTLGVTEPSKEDGGVEPSQSMERGYSLQEMLAIDRQDGSGTGPSDRSELLPQQTSSATITDINAARKKRNRWSLLDGLRSAPTPMPNSQSMSTSLSSTSVSESRRSMTGSPIMERPTRQRTHSSSAISNASLPSAPDGQTSATSQTPSRGSISPHLKARPAPLIDDNVPFTNLQPELESAASADGATVTYTRSDISIVGSLGKTNTVNGLHGNASPGTLGVLEYVKLAKTKNSRFIRASETSKRTYLAVLCGDAGERIELFTGSKNVSLSLNRTFVLPETPRTIEFQLQGEDLLDLYLIYDSAIFALEPSTVRVREVGILRNERRAARRERERQARESATLDSRAPSRLSTHVTEQGGLSGEGTAMANEAEELPPPPLTPLTDAPPSVTTVNTQLPVTAEAGNADSTQSSNDSPTDGISAISFLPYTTFQQLEYLPILPPSVLSSSYIIPPTYESVLAASPQPNQDAVFNVMSPNLRPVSPALSMLPNDVFLNTSTSNTATPLLSPVSLLANPTARNAGPPGLFFVSKGRTLTSIVDGDGRSVVRKPISWASSTNPAPSTADQAEGLDVFTRLEILLTGGKTNVCLIAYSPTTIRAIELGSPFETSIEVIPPDSAKKKAKSQASNPAGYTAREPEDTFVRDVTFLAKNGEVSYFAERVGTTVTIHAIGAIGEATPAV